MYFYIKNRENKLPIVLIPGLFGSLGDDIILGTGDLNFGMAEPLYRPLINNLEEIGYKEGENLFIAFYDWRKGCEYNTEKYLIPKIEEAKSITNSSMVDIIGHSLGGIVARAYIQGSLYKDDVRNLIMMGTPNAGAVNAYYFWSGGQVPYDKLEKNLLYQLIKIGFFWIYRFLHGQISDLNILRSIFPVVQELLPSFEYGDYLFVDDNSGFKKPVNIKNMDALNSLLSNMNKNIHLIYNKGIKLHHVIGTGFETTDIICVSHNESESEKWKDGKPLYSISMPYGDGTITISSAESIYSKNYYLKENHGDILKKSKDILASILKCPTIQTRDKEQKNETRYFYSIILKNISETEIVFSRNEKRLNIMKASNTDGYITREMGENLYWIMINTKEKENLKLELDKKNREEYELLVFYAKDKGDIKMIRKNHKDYKSLISIYGDQCL